MASRSWRPNGFIWRVAETFDRSEDLARSLGTTTLVAQVLHNRGIDKLEDARAFLKPKLTDLHDPLLLGGIPQAAERIAKAVADGEKIVIYGDYDVDGITAVAILHACLTMVGARVSYYVPHRLDEGYGLNAEAVDKLVADATNLIITVDCGISAGDQVAMANRAGVDVIITDHHIVPDHLPDAIAIVHPAVGGTYPNQHLAGAGVAFKLAWQVARQICGEQRVSEQMRNFLLDATTLAALGTIADVVPLVGENRTLATFGLRGLTATKHPGLRALVESAGLAGEKLDAYHVGFRLAPRLNAAGRMGHARDAIELLTTARGNRPREIAAFLDTQNTERRNIEQGITAEAIETVESTHLDSPDRHVIVLGSENWHGGIIGIVASRLVDRFNKPAVMVALTGERGQGSGRSVPGFNLFDAISACSEHLESFGGHAMAAGLRIRRSNLDNFADAMETYAAAHIDESAIAPTLQIDAETTLGSLNFKTVDLLRRLAPFGRGNTAPVVAIRGCQLLNPPRRIGRSGQTVTMTLAHGGTTIRAIGFSMGDLPDHLVGVNHIDVAAEPVINTFRGRSSVELQIRDVQW